MIYWWVFVIHLSHLPISSVPKQVPFDPEIASIAKWRNLPITHSEDLAEGIASRAFPTCARRSSRVASIIGRCEIVIEIALLFERGFLRRIVLILKLRIWLRNMIFKSVPDIVVRPADVRNMECACVGLSQGVRTWR